jgi:phage terminase large subunit-like protein
MAEVLAHNMLEHWRSKPAAFIEEVLRDPETGKPFKLLPAERDFLAYAFRTGDDGRLLYPEQVFAAPKKSGKTTFAAFHTLVTVLLFGGAFAEGIVAANDFEQRVGRVFKAVQRIVEASPLLRAEARVLSDRIEFSTGATITAIPSDYAGAAGANPNVSTFDELWGYVSERSHRLWDELVPPPTRKIACRLVVTYAGFEGESGLLEQLYKRGLAQSQIGVDLYAGDGLLMYWTHDVVAPWQTPAWIAQMRRSLRPNQYLRMIENRFTCGEAAFVDMAWFDQCVDPAAKPLLGDKHMPVWLGVDASVKRDSTAIVVVGWDKAASKARMAAHRIFQPSPQEPLDFEATVERTVRELCQRFAVRRVLYDPYQMAAVAQRLQSAGVPMREYPQTLANLTAIGSNLYELIKGGNLIVYPDDGIRLSISRAIAKETPRGFQITKEKCAHKIDVVVALAMAAYAAVQQSHVEEVPIVVPYIWSKTSGVISDPCPGAASRNTTAAFYAHGGSRDPFAREW